MTKQKTIETYGEAESDSEDAEIRKQVQNLKKRMKLEKSLMEEIETDLEGEGQLKSRRLMIF
ncbi:MAG: hypothetical protein V8R90_04935 [Eubacterium sp.]